MRSETITSIDRIYELLPSWLGRDYAVDCETSHLDHHINRLLGISLCFGDEEECYYIVFEHNLEDWQGNPVLTNFINREEGMGLLRALFSQPEIRVAAHNAKYEIRQFRQLGVRIEGRLFDTLLSSQLLNENGANGLKSLAPSVGITYDKYQEKVKYAGYTKNEILGAPLNEVAEYAIFDALATWRLYEKFRKEMSGATFESAFYDVWMPLMLTIVDMEEAGIKVDRAQAQKLLEEHTMHANLLQKDVQIEGLKMLACLTPEAIPDLYLTVATPEQLEQSYEGIDGYQKVDVDGVPLPLITHDMKGKTKRWATRIPTFNTGSDKQLIELLFNHLGLADQELPFALKQTPSGEISVDKDNIQTLVFAYGENVPKVLSSLLEWRKSEKFNNTYLKTLVEKPDEADRIHANFNQAVSERGGGGTATGRLSSSNPNLQNQPSRGDIGKQARSLFIAGEGQKLLVSDYENLELRILGHYSQDAALVKAFSEGLDLHSMTAANQNNIDYQTFMDGIENGNPEYKSMRMVGKVSNFGLAYGMGPKKFQRYLLVNSDTFVSLDEAARLIEGYNETFSGAQKWKQRVYAHAKQLGFVRTIAGRHRRLPELYSKDRYLVMRAERQAVNAIIQGSAADVIMEVMPPLHNALKAVGGRLLLQVHDEIVGEIPEEFADIGVKIMDTLMVDIPNRKLRVPLSAHAAAGDNWYSTKG